MATSLELNGCEFDATDAEVVAWFHAGAGGDESEEALTECIRDHRAARG